MSGAPAHRGVPLRTGLPGSVNHMSRPHPGSVNHTDRPHPGSASYWADPAGIGEPLGEIGTAVAAPSGQLKVTRYFAALAIIIAIVWAFVFLTGDKKPHPKLGLDLQGGTSMTLSATSPNGKPPDGTKMEQARQIIASRVNASGVAEPEVVTEGRNNIVVNVAGGASEDKLRSLVAPAVMRFRAVLGTSEDKPLSAVQPSASGSASPSASGSAKASGTPSAGASASGTPSASKSATPAPSGSASPSAAPSGTAAPSPSASVAPNVAQTLAEVKAKLGPVYQLGESVTDPTHVTDQNASMLSKFSELSGTEVAALPVTMQYNIPNITCAQLNDRPPGSIVDPKQQAVACETGSNVHTKYLLDQSKVLGEDVADATSGYDPANGGWHVQLKFKGSGGDRWTNLTKEAMDKQKQDGQPHAVAIVLDNTIVSAPNIKDIIVGPAIINGGNINDKSAATLATQLKYGSLPLNFKVENLSTVSPTLGTAQMKAGLLAGLIGLALVVLYCLFYYRALGLVVIASLGVSAAILYGLLVLLGRSLGYTLSLAGIAGFIVAIGITADSFVVFFERLKDEVKDGRSVRSAVPRAWVRARRTILSADAVSFLAAAVLYILGQGAVKGFAFTLGMSTIVDVLIVFIFTHPLVSVLARSKAFTSPRFSGLGNAREHPAATAPAPRFGTARTRES